jgi:hypothetical protein
MASPLDQVVYNQEAGYMPIKVMVGDGVTGIRVDIPFIITGYTFDGSVYDSLSNLLFDFTAPTISQTTPTGIVTYPVSTVQVGLLTTGAVYRLRWINSAIPRTFAHGPFEVIPV